MHVAERKRVARSLMDLFDMIKTACGLSSESFYRIGLSSIFA
jgi:hypothetical protein